MKLNKDILILALLVGILPPIWAVLSGHVGVSVGAVSLITAGIYNADINQKEDKLSISLGLLMGDIWGFLGCSLTQILSFNIDISLFLVLFVLGIVAVVLTACFKKYLFLPAYLGGWAISMTVLTLNITYSMISMTIQIGIAMLVGVWYVGVFLNFIASKLSNH